MIGKNGGLPNGWEWASFGDVVIFVRGVSFSGGSAEKAAAEGLVPLLTATNISDELLLDRDLIWVPKTSVQDEQLLAPGDIVMCLSSGSASVVGKSAPLRKKWVGTVGAFCCILRPKGSAEPEFIAHALRSPLFYEWRDANARGANIQNLRTSELSGWQLAIPARAFSDYVASYPAAAK